MQRVEFSGNRAWLSGVSEADVQIDPYMQILRKLPIVPTCEERREEEAGNDWQPIKSTNIGGANVAL